LQQLPGILALTLEKLRSMGEYERHKDISILVGRKKNCPKGEAWQGCCPGRDCLKKYRDQGSLLREVALRQSLPLWASLTGKTTQK